ncbi:MAG: NlpBDapX lipoprotein [Proteobacteria bacterium]|nr:NlpBDapX lipoprotein [Pseudomonadota bacterium]
MKRIIALLCISLATVLAGCSGFSILPETRKIDYKTAGKAAPLDVPPDLTQQARNDRYFVPDASGKGVATASGYQAERSSVVRGDSTVLPQVEKVRVERAGSERWLVVSLPADKIWPTLKDFWQEMGFIVKVEVPEAGIMETDWAENRAKIPDDFIRNMLGKLLETLYSTGERDKFRTRLEPGREPGTTDIFISHRGMIEVYTSGKNEDTRWQPRQPDTELEAEMLRRLMVRFGTDEKRSEAVMAAAKTEPRAKLTQSADGSGTVEVQESFDRAWRRVGLVLDRVGFTVVDRDRAKGIYFVRYVDPGLDSKKEDKGWLAKWAFWRSKDDPLSKEEYRIYVRDTGSVTTVQVLSREGGIEKSETARKILGLLHEQLK